MSEEYQGLKSARDSGQWTARSRWRLFLIILSCLVILPVQAVLVRLPGFLWWPGARLWHQAVLCCLRVTVRKEGHPRAAPPCLYVANHISWLDIMVLGSVLPRASFVAKAEIQSWGAVGALCGLQKTVFVDRARRSDSGKQRDRLAQRIADGDSLILFPEGTSTDGGRVAPFKSALFSVAERADMGRETPLIIQPIALTYSRINGAPFTRRHWPLVAWIGDMELLSHLRAFLDLGHIEAMVDFGSAFTLQDQEGRKAAASFAFTQVADGVARARRQHQRYGD